MPTFGYMIVIQDNMSDNCKWGVPDWDSIEQVVHTSYEGAKAALNECVKNFETFIPVAYGKAFPYEAATFEKLLETDFFAPYGWVVRELDDDQYRIAVGLFKVRIN
jgi:hypothetical protein